MKRFFQGILLLSRPYFQSSQKWRILLMVFGMVLLIITSVFTEYLYYAWQKDFYDALQTLNQKEIYKNLVFFFMLLALLILTLSLSFYMQAILGNHWRIWMTNYYFEYWLQDQNYYWMQKNMHSIDSPDQRICEDIALYCDLVLLLSTMVLQSVLALIVFTGLLWNLSESVNVGNMVVHGLYVWIALLYALIASGVTHYIGKRLLKLEYDKQKREASLRNAMMRLRESSTSIALWKAETYQLNFLRKFLQDVNDIVVETIRQRRNLNFFKNGYSNLSSLMGRFIALPQFISGSIQLGDLMQIGAAFGSVQNALSMFVQNYENFAELGAVMKRLLELQACHHSISPSRKIQRLFSHHDYLEVSGLSLDLPEGEPLLKNINFKVKAGEKIYLSGHPGSGKTSLQCALAGLWPHGQGKIILPEQSKILFIPEQMYIPPGTLRQILLFPESALEISEEKLKNILTACFLDAFCLDLDTHKNWGQILSQSELQCINFTRILLHNPDFVIADNLFGYLSKAVATELMIECQACLPHVAWLIMGANSENFPFLTQNIQLNSESFAKKQPIV